MKKIKIAGVEYTITLVTDPIDVSHDKGSKRMLRGEISHLECDIRLLVTNRSHMARTIVHELLHGVIEGYQIRELMDDDGNHREIAINQLSVGLCEAIESIGIDILGQLDSQTLGEKKPTR